MHPMLFNCGFFCLLTPVLAVVLTLLYIYRLIVETVLKHQFKDRFAGLLEGTDCVWAVEEPSALSVINVLVVLEVEQYQANENVLENFRNLIKDRLIGSPFEKILYLRNKKYGYYFWEKAEEIDLEERVRWLEHDSIRCDGYCDDIYGESLRKALERNCNQPLPQDHSTSWEILVSKNCPRAAHQRIRRIEESRSILDRGRRNKVKIPVLFRIHHALGDGNSLLKLFLEAIADKSTNDLSIITEEKCMVKHRMRDRQVISKKVPTFARCAKGFNDCEDSYYSSAVLSASMPFADLQTLRIVQMIVQNFFYSKIKQLEHVTFDEVKNEMHVMLHVWWTVSKDFFVKQIYQRIQVFARTMIVLILMPAYLMEQAVRNMDNNSLHGSKLTGQKIVTYWSEDDYRNASQEKLLTKIKEIKYITGARFVEVWLAALSSSLHKYLLRVDEVPPNSLTVVLPAQMENPKDNVYLANDISVGLLPLCISEINGRVYTNPDDDSRTAERLREIMKLNNQLKEDLDYSINFWVMKFLSAVLPDKFLRPLLQSHSTMAFSNLPGCQEVRIAGYPVKNIIFWIPNKSNTGVGCSLFSYNGKLHLSIVADKALVKDEKVFSKILGNTVYEIDKLHENLTSTRFSKKFHHSAKAPMDTEIGVLRS
ncbi:hypothetical protein KPH14_003317 [Odynerus spinipes]|uniref:O-acyltransferase WSD1 C-terminal domain-containing protein n=1 Tax=Odynerus spinipes TaxID=1348599 RepID=A0AAD9VKJ1_9HYME|nr:hypothetical protein KPH14_003317 [Odynerus spinipes]